MQTHNTGYQFDSSVCHNKNAIGEDSNGKSPHKITVLAKAQSPVSGFCYVRNRVCNAAFDSVRPVAPQLELITRGPPLDYFDYRRYRVYFTGLCRGKAMVAYTKSQQRKKEGNEKLRG